MNRAHPLLPLLAITALVVVGATACGESRSDKEAKSYADGLCTKISGWEQQIVGIASTLDSGGPRTTAETKLTQAKSATIDLVDEIHGLEVPGVDGAAEAKQNVDRFVRDSEATVKVAKTGIKQLQTYGTDTANVATVVVPISLRLTSLAKEAKSTVTSLGKVKGPFEQAVKKSEACQALKPANDDQES
jgi:hypothetical protein